MGTVSPSWGFMSTIEAPAEVQEDAALQGPVRRMLLYVINDRKFAAEMSTVREMVSYQAVTRVPGSPPAVCGLMNLRGTIVTVLDVGLRLGMPGCHREGGTILLVPFREKLVGLAIDDVIDIQPVPEETIRGALDREWFDPAIVAGVAEIDGESITVLDLNKLVNEVLG